MQISEQDDLTWNKQECILSSSLGDFWSILLTTSTLCYGVYICWKAVEPSCSSAWRKNTKSTCQTPLIVSYLAIFIHASKPVSNITSLKGTIKDLLVWIKANLLKQKPELFLQDDSM